MEKYNMIPKVIHYIWLGGNPLPKLADKCIESWKKFCPDWEIKRWDEENLNLDINTYCRQAYDSKKFAFASDVLRFDILSREGGVYVDIDVEFLKPIDELLDQECFLGLEDDRRFFVAPGLIMGSVAGGELVQKLLDNYSKDVFLNEDGSQNMETVCVKTTNLLLNDYGMQKKNEVQDLGKVKVYATEYFNPTNIATQKVVITPNTYTIHHYNSSWYTGKMKFKKGVKTFLNKITFGLFGKLFLNK